MTLEEIARGEVLLKAATPRPWKQHGARPTEVWSPCGSILVANCQAERRDPEHREQAIPNTALLVWLANNGDALLALARRALEGEGEVERVKGENARLRGLLDAMTPLSEIEWQAVIEAMDFTESNSGCVSDAHLRAKPQVESRRHAAAAAEVYRASDSRPHPSPVRRGGEAP